MKAKILLLLAVIMIVAVPAFAVDESYYGTRLTVNTRYDYDSYQYDGDGDHYAEYYLSKGQESPIWSPDGQSIICTGMIGFGLWQVPATGGQSVLIYNNYHKQAGYVYNGVDISGGFMKPLGFTPDGTELTFYDTILDPNRGSLIEETSTGLRVWHPIPIIRNINLATGAVRTIVEDAEEGCWSPDGRYLVYKWMSTGYTEPTRTENEGSIEGYQWGIKVLDTQTGEIRTLVMWAYSPTVTPDGQYVVYSSQTSAVDGPFTSYGQEYNLYRIPITGGTPEQLTFYSQTTECRSPSEPAVSPDGEWVLFTGWFQEENAWLQGLCAFNLNTRESFKAFPRADLSTLGAKWSPDGKKFVYWVKPSGGITFDSEIIYTVDFQPTPFWKPTAVVETTPAAFAITGNHPNPFNPFTTIGFTLAEPGSATLSIYNVAGQKVRELVTGPLSAGIHSVVWDGRDMNGMPVSSGVYLTRLLQGNKTAVGRMLLAK